MRKLKACRVYPNGVQIVFLLVLIIFGSLTHLAYRKYHSTNLDIIIAVNKFHFQKPSGVEPRSYFCFDLYGNNFKKHKACNLGEVSTKYCGIQNEGPDGWDSSFLKQSPDKMAEMTINQLQEFNCQYVTIDFEGLEEEVDLEDYWNWLRRYSELLKKHFTLSFAAYAKISKTTNNIAARYHDYSKICHNFNEIWIMSYDYHLPVYTPPGELAPIEWVKQVVDHASRHCSKEQIRIGLAAYGYDWNSGEIIYEIDQMIINQTNVFIETVEKRREKITYFMNKEFFKFFIWADGMFLKAI